MVVYFALNLLCAYVSCVPYFEAPSDPLASQRQIETDRVSRNSVDSELDLIVSTKIGFLEGYVQKTIKGRQIYAFEGIPYGETTGGKNRFEPPIPKAPWKGVRQAKNPGEYCVQWHAVYFHVFGSEDCLTLNLYTPKLPSKERNSNPNLPVLVFIHGGAYFFGSGSEYGPAYLLENDVILVTIQYRLGIMGFLSTGDSVLPGNNGLKDQSLALKWVYENIEAFGGNPDRITLMGQSSGAASVHMHMMSSMSKPYFSSAISMSGSAFNPWALGNRAFANDVVQRVSNVTRCSSKSSQAFVNCLRSINPYRLTTKLTQLYPLGIFPPSPVSPVVEQPGPNAFLTKHPNQAYADGDVAKIPWIYGNTEDEGAFPWEMIAGYRGEIPFTPVWNQVGEYVMFLSFNTPNVTAVNKKINKFYFGAEKINVAHHLPAFMELFTDRFFAYASHKSLQLHSMIAPSYSYRFGYKQTKGVAAALGFNKDKYAVGHIDDLPLIFNMTRFFPGYKTTDKDYAVIKLLTSLIVNFAATGEPLYNDGKGQVLKIWEPVKDPRNITQLQINTEVKMVPEPNLERLKFWETLKLDDTIPFIPVE